MISTLKRREAAATLATIALIGVTALVNPRFVVANDAIRNLLLSPAILIVISVAQAIVIITKNVDLSLSATLAISAYTTGWLFKNQPSIPDFVVILIAIGLGGVLGAINGLLVSLGKIPSLVVTLGTLYAYRGLLVMLAGTTRIVPGDLPTWLRSTGTATVWGLPVLTLVAVVVVIGVGYFMARRRGGREMYAIGSNLEAAELFGLPVNLRVPIAFVISGTLAGVAGVMWAARYASISSIAGTGVEFDTVAAAVIGGVSMNGGVGTVAGAAIGAILLSTIGSALPTMAVSEFWQKSVVGALILGAIVLDRVLAARRARKLRIEASVKRPAVVSAREAMASTQEGGGTQR